MTTLQYIVAGIISLLAFSLMILRHIYPAYVIDTTTLGLLGLAVLPWLSLFFKKFKIPGIVEGESHDRVQSSTDSPTPPSPKLTTAINENIEAIAPLARFQSLPPESQKILRTLWRYQKDLFKTDYSRRWTFCVRPNAPDYLGYLDGLSTLMKENLVSVAPESYQSMLTNEGIIFMESLEGDDLHGDFYVF